MYLKYEKLIDGSIFISVKKITEWKNNLMNLGIIKFLNHSAVLLLTLSEL